MGKPPAGLSQDENDLFRVLRISALTQIKGWKKIKPPDLIRWKSTIQEVQLVEKVTHTIRNMEDVFEKR